MVLACVGERGGAGGGVELELSALRFLTCAAEHAILVCIGERGVGE